MDHYSSVVQDSSGNAVAAATITVTLAGTATVATIYSDDGITTTSNPLTSDATGNFDFYAADGRYDVVITGTATGANYDVVLMDGSSASTDDEVWTIRAATITEELKTPLAAPATPVAGDLWQSSGVVKFGASSKTLANLSTAQSWTAAQTYSQPIVSTVATGTAPFTVASTTVVTNLCADKGDSATAFFTTGNIELARCPVGTSNQILGTNSGASAQEHKTLSSGTSGTDFAIAHSAGAIAFNLPDAGASARGAVTTGTQTLAGAKTFSGTLTPTGGVVATGRSKYSTVTIGAVAYGSFGAAVNPVAGTIYIAEVFIPRNVTLTGVGFLNAGTVGTNKVIVALFTTAGGAAVANSALAGTLTSGPNAFQEVAFTGTYAAIGPARAWIGLQFDGATDNFRAIAASTFIDVLTKSYAGAFGTIGSLTIPTTFAASVGGIAYVYA